jgi:hypothetical protein
MAKPLADGGVGRWRRLAPWLLGASALAGAWHWSLAHGLPQWLPGQVWPLLERELGTPVRWQALEVSPWTLKVTLHGLHVGPPEQPLLQVRTLTVQPSWELLWRWAPVLRRVTVEGPQLHISRLAPGQFNFSPLVAHWQQRHPPQPQADSAEPARFAVYNIAIDDGAVLWQDQVLSQRHRVDQVHLGVPFVSNLPSFMDAEVEPALSARVDGSPLKVEGETLPFQQGRRSQVHVRWQGVSLPQLMEAVHPFVPAAWRPVTQAGTLGSDLTVRFEARTAPEPPRLSVSGSLVLDDLDLAWPTLALPPVPGSLPGEAPLSAAVAWKRLAITGIDAQPLLQQARVGELRVEGAQLRVAPGQATGEQAKAKPAGADHGKSAAATSAVQPASPASPNVPAKTTRPWDWSVGRVQVQLQHLDVQPWRPQAGVKAWPRIEGLAATVTGLRSGEQAPAAQWRLAWQDSAGGLVSAQGQAQLARAQASAQLSWSALPLADWTQAPMQALGLPVRLQNGALAGRLNLSWSPPGQPQVKANANDPEPAKARQAKAGAPAGTSQPGRPSASGLNWGGGELHLTGLLVQPVAEARASARAAAGPVGKGVKGVKGASPPANRVALQAVDVLGLQGHWAPPASDGPSAGQAAPQPQFAAQAIRLQGLDAAVVREPGQRWFGLVLPPSGAGEGATATLQGDKATSVAQAPAPGSLPPGTPHLSLGAWTCEACTLLLDDRSVSPATRLALGPLHASVQGLDTDRLADPIRFELDTRVLDSGRLQAKGQARLQPLSADTQVQLKQLELKSLQPYLDPHVNVVLMGAQPELDGHVRWQAATARQPQQLRYTGHLGVRALRLQDRINAADVLSWQRFSLDGADLSLQGEQVDAKLGRIQLQDFYGRIIVNPDGRLNLASILRSERGGATTSVTTPQAAADVASAPAVAPAVAANASPSPSAPRAMPSPRLSWQGVTLAGGRVDFTDHFIQPNYSARLTQVQGEVSAVSSQQAEPATVSISGAVDDAAPLRISGRVQPFGAKLFTDIEGSAKGIELTRLTPYAARYAGYGIDKGTLSVTVHYKVDQGKLEASNRIFLDQFTFGAPSDSPDALKLPIQFAVSLLKNARGEIDVNLPISGSLNDPQFSLGGIIWQVFVNLITKAVTAPFALLAGGDGEDWGHVPFDAGSAELNDTALKRLEGLAKSLADHPALKLEATGHADPAADVLALRQQHLARLMRAAKARATGQALADARVTPAEQDGWLAAAYQAADLPTKPRNALGLPKTLPPAEMRQLLLASAPADGVALRELANARADQVKAYLAARIAPERVLLTASQTSAGDDKLPPARVQMVLR